MSLSVCREMAEEKTKKSKSFAGGRKQRRKHSEDDDEEDEWNNVISQSQTMTNAALSLQSSAPLIVRLHLYRLVATCCFFLLMGCDRYISHRLIH